MLLLLLYIGDFEIDDDLPDLVEVPVGLPELEPQTQELPYNLRKYWYVVPAPMWRVHL